MTRTEVWGSELCTSGFFRSSDILLPRPCQDQVDEGEAGVELVEVLAGADPHAATLQIAVREGKDLLAQTVLLLHVAKRAHRCLIGHRWPRSGVPYGQMFVRGVEDRWPLNDASATTRTVPLRLPGPTG